MAKEQNMEHGKHSAREEQREEHSLPGTNQAGKEASSPCEEDEQEHAPGESALHHQDLLEEHSLPGTNQAGKEPAACEDDEQ
jgi:hypothetical protein